MTWNIRARVYLLSQDLFNGPVLNISAIPQQGCRGISQSAAFRHGHRCRGYPFGKAAAPETAGSYTSYSILGFDRKEVTDLLGLNIRLYSYGDSVSRLKSDSYISAFVHQG